MGYLCVSYGYIYLFNESSIASIAKGTACFQNILDLSLTFGYIGFPLKRKMIGIAFVKSRITE